MTGPARSILFLAAVFFLPLPLGAQGPPSTGREVMERYAEQDRTRDSRLTLSMMLVDAKGRERRRKLSMATRTRQDGTRMQLIRFLEPADIEGTGFLSIENSGREDDAWLYLPALRRVRRIAGTDKRDSFVGTDFTFEDLEPEVLDDHAYTLVREDSVDGMATWVVEAVPVDARRAEASGYGRRELWITQDHALLVQARLYDREGEYVRRLTAGDPRAVPGSGKWRTYRIVMEDVREASRTRLEIEDLRIDQGVDPALFTERYLRRGG